MNETVPLLIPTKPEAEIALEIKKEVEEKLLELCRIMDRANRSGFIVGFQLGVIPPGKNILQLLHIAKHY